MKTLQVGKSYKDGHGDSYTISLNEGQGKEHYPYKGTNLETGDQWVFTKQGFFTPRATGCDDLIIPDEPEQTTELTKEDSKVKHLEVILAIVQGTLVQYDYMLTGTWHDYEHNTGMSPVDHPEYNWRIKPQPEPKRTVQIGKRTVVAPEVNILHTGCEYFYIDRSQGKINLGVWSDHNVDKKRLELGNIFMLEQDAINCQEAISALLLGKD